MKRILAGLILATFFINSSSIQAFAKESNGYEEESPTTIGELGGYREGNLKTVENRTIERKFT